MLLATTVDVTPRLLMDHKLAIAVSQGVQLMIFSSLIYHAEPIRLSLLATVMPVTHALV
jgi:hypothetical protein